MWIVYAFASAFFAGIVSILAKIGIKNTDANLATALRTIVVFAFAWLMVFVAGSPSALSDIDTKSLVFLVLSGLATGASWMCYFKALQTGDVNKVVPVDKSSVVLTMVASSLFLGEGMNVLKAASITLIGVGTYLMIERKNIAIGSAKGGQWFVYAALSAVFAALTAILGKIGIVGVETNLGTAIRTAVVLVMAWTIVIFTKKQREIKQIDRRSWVFIVLSGLATGLSWLCFYHALGQGPVGVVVPIDKLSIIITVAFGHFVLRERLKKKPAAGLLLIVTGTMSLLFV